MENTHPDGHASTMGENPSERLKLFLLFLSVILSFGAVCLQLAARSQNARIEAGVHAAATRPAAQITIQADGYTVAHSSLVPGLKIVHLSPKNAHK